MAASPTLDLALALIGRPSITPDDGGCQQLLSQRLAAHGFRIEWMNVAGVTNLWARYGDQAPLLCFAGHTDVVPPGKLTDWHSDPFSPEIRDGLLYGRGAADMKSSLAAMVVAAESFLAQHPKPAGSLAFLLTSDEEGAAINGTRWVMEQLNARGERIDYCVVGEPSSRERLGDQIKQGRRGSLNARLRVIGKQGHVAYPHLADNPIHRVAPTLARLCAEVWDQGSETFPPTSLQISNLQAGVGAENVIPCELTAQFNLRFAPQDIEQLKQRVQALFEQNGLEYQLEWTLSGEPFFTAEGALIAATREAIRTVVGYEPLLSTDGGTSDGRFIAPTGAEVIELGPLNATIHKVNEAVPVADLEPLTAIYAQILERILQP